jgi:predicted dehydrogenase
MEGVSVLVVGTGILGKRHARVLHELEHARLAGVVSRSAERAAALAGRYGAPGFTDLEAAMAASGCDAVVVATPDHLHLHPVMQALERGRHVLVEKPLATDRSEAQQMVGAARRADLVLQVNYSQRRLAENAWIKDRVQEGVIGHPVMVQSSKIDTLFVPTRMIDWAAETSPLYFMSSHELDLVGWFLESSAERVSAHEHRGVLARRGIAAHDGVDALVTYRSGAVASFHSSWIFPESYPQLVVYHMTLIGERGMIHLESLGRRVECYAEAGGETISFTGPATADEVEGRLEGAFRATLEEFVGAVREGTEPEISAARTLHVTETQIAILEAVRTGSPATVPHSA